MSKAPIRTRLVSFRVSEREYASVQRTCDRVKAESLSEFARKAIFHYADELAPAGPAPTDLHVQLDLVTIQLQSLGSALGQLKECLMGAIGQDKEAVRENGHGNNGRDNGVDGHRVDGHANGAELLLRAAPLAEEAERDS